MFQFRASVEAGRQVPEYELRGPGEPVRDPTIRPAPLAAGVPVLICADGTFEPDIITPGAPPAVHAPGPGDTAATLNATSLLAGL